MADVYTIQVMDSPPWVLTGPCYALPVERVVSSLVSDGPHVVQLEARTFVRFGLAGPLTDPFMFATLNNTNRMRGKRPPTR